MRLVFSHKNSARKEKTVILLHGLARTYRSMKTLGNYLSKHGFNVIYIDYPSRKFSIEQLADRMHEFFRQNHIVLDKNINIVTHSLGGIIVRLIDQKYGLNINRVVMISPPNQGSEIADHLKKIKLFKKIIGPALIELGTDGESIPRQLSPAHFELGIITGNVSLNPLFSSWIKGESDGKVSVDSARMDGLSDFVIVPYSHCFICHRENVLKLALNFLCYGHFLGK